MISTPELCRIAGQLRQGLTSWFERVGDQLLCRQGKATRALPIGQANPPLRPMFDLTQPQRMPDNLCADQAAATHNPFENLRKGALGALVPDEACKGLHIFL